MATLWCLAIVPEETTIYYSNAKDRDARKPGTMMEMLLNNEIAIRLGFFGGIFAVMAAWELLAPRRKLRQSKAVRWYANVGIVVLN